MDENFSNLEKRGVVTRGDAQFGASPVTVVKRKNGSLRVCENYTFFNKYTLPLSHTLSCIDQLSYNIPEGTKIFSILDIKGGVFFASPRQRRKKVYANNHKIRSFHPTENPVRPKERPLEIPKYDGWHIETMSKVYFCTPWLYSHIFWDTTKTSRTPEDGVDATVKQWPVFE